MFGRLRTVPGGGSAAAGSAVGLALAIAAPKGGVVLAGRTALAEAAATEGTAAGATALGDCAAGVGARLAFGDEAAGLGAAEARGGGEEGGLPAPNAHPSTVPGAGL
ncbi:MAG: hypothetical protein QOI82_1261 [Actinomycetota bacterium]|nr:hypothetical protein [Actinomycetota bacterium]